jgi:N-acyl-D-aspartate/D-glutamate deacylase
MGDLGAGVFELTTEPAMASPDKAERQEFYARLRDLAVETRVPITFGLGAAPPRCYEVLDLMDEAATHGGRMFGQTHSRGISVVLSFKSRLPFDGLPGWKELRQQSLAEQERVLRDPDARRRLIDVAEHGQYPRAIGAEARQPDFDRLFVLERALPPNPTVAELAAKRGVSPVELMIDLSLERGFDQFFLQPLGPTDPEHMLNVMKHPRTVMTFSDSGAHVSQIADSSIHTYLLAHWVRQRQAFTLEEAVRMLTLAPATAWGFADRGLLREGLAADINVFDPNVVAPVLPELARDFPASALRLIQKSVGFKATIVAGQVLLSDGQHTGALPGQLLRGPLADRARPAATSAQPAA